MSAPMRAPASAVLLFVLLTLLMPASGIAQQIDDPNTDPRVREVARDLQCPVCENLSVADSPSGLAAEMRTLIARKLEEGWSREQIERYFVERYGPGMLLTPPRSGFSALVWLGPWIVLGLGLVLVATTVGLRRRGTRRSAVTAPDSQPDDRYEQQLDSELASLRERSG